MLLTVVALTLFLSAIALWAELSYGSLDWAEDLGGETS
jgi:hypothetical protein